MKIGIKENNLVIIPTKTLDKGKEYPIPLEIIKELIAKEKKKKTK